MQEVVPGRAARPRLGAALAAAGLLVTAALAPSPGMAQPDAGEALDAVVHISARVPGDARTASTLGTDRQGTGVLIDNTGLIVTIGYLILEASEIEVRATDGGSLPATIVAYDHESGFGLVRAEGNVGAAPIAFGDSDALSLMQPLLLVSQAGAFDAEGVYLVDRREFAGYWEYLLDDALFTTPPHPEFGGAALLDSDGQLVGIGSLFVNDAAFQGRPIPGNMFVPINQLKPILADLLADGRRADPPRPWLGVSLEEHRGRVFVTRVSPDGPGAAGGIEPDDVILGVDGVEVEGLADFYRKLWAQGDAGVEVPLDVLRGVEVRTRQIRSGDRYRYLRLNPTW